MREEQLIDAIGKLDAEVFTGIEKLRAENAAKTAEIIPIRMKRRSMRKWLVPVAACLVLMLGGFAAYASGALDGLLHIGTDDNGNKTVAFTPPENITVPVTELSADVQNLTVQMKDRLQYYLAEQPLPNDEMVGMFTTDRSFVTDPNEARQPQNTYYIGYADGERPNLPYSFNVGLPGTIYKPFNSIAAAEAYIGFEGLHMPVLNETPLQIGVLVKGVNEGGLSNATPDSEFDICDVSLYTSYMPFGRYTAVCSAHIETGIPQGVRTMTYMDSENALLSSETRTVGNRQFTVMTYQENPGTDEYSKNVILVENRVTYTLSVYGSEDCPPETVEQLITEWMNSFS
jgi:hypothetical protein